MPSFEPVEVGGFLPESFVWHVGLGLLRALQWLHEGVRDTYLAVPAAGRFKGFRRVRGKTDAELDWMPVLHRNLKAENVFLQHPKGFETYGAVKLGSFEKCHISGSVAKLKGVPVVAMETEDGVPLGTLRERTGRWKRDGLDVPRVCYFSDS
jgi:serine/threonine protein kinase